MTELVAKGLDGVITANESKILIRRKGLFGVASSLSGNGDEAIPMERVGKVVLQKANMLVNGSLQIGVYDKDGTAEAAEGLAGWMASTLSGNLKHNIIFTKSANSDFEAIKDFIEAQIKINESKPRTTTVVNAGIAGKADEIKKLADLRDQGILTDQEFEAEKKKLLS
jgi:hypothetical protein